MDEAERQVITEMAIDQFQRIRDDPYDGGRHVQTLLRILEALPRETRHSLMQGKKTIIAKALTGTASRSSAHYLSRMMSASVALQEAGLVDAGKGFRDIGTGRKVKSIIGELARLTFASDQALIEMYLTVRDWPLEEVKTMVRANRGVTFIPDTVHDV